MREGTSTGQETHESELLVRPPPEASRVVAAGARWGRARPIAPLERGQGEAAEVINPTREVLEIPPTIGSPSCPVPIPALWKWRCGVAWPRGVDVFAWESFGGDCDRHHERDRPRGSQGLSGGLWRSAGPWAGGPERDVIFTSNGRPRACGSRTPTGSPTTDRLDDLRCDLGRSAWTCPVQTR